MKLIVVGGTGLIGEAVLRQAIRETKFTSIVALSRRELATEISQDPKIQTIIMKDFSEYDKRVVERLQGSEVCIWAMGGRRNQFNDAKTAHQANVDYLLVAGKVFAEKLAPSLPESKKFRFVYCSGSFAERDMTKRLFFMSETRKLKGEAETGLIEVEASHKDKFEVFIARPAGVLEADRGFQNMLAGPMGIGKGQLSLAMINIAVQGSETQVTENAQLREKGRGVPS